MSKFPDVFRIHYVVDDERQPHATVYKGVGATPSYYCRWDTYGSEGAYYTEDEIEKFLANHWVMGHYVEQPEVVEGGTKITFYYIGYDKATFTAEQTEEGDFMVTWGGPLNTVVYYTVDQVKGFISSGTWVVVGVC